MCALQWALGYGFPPSRWSGTTTPCCLLSPALPFMALLVAEQGWRALRHRPALAHLAAISLLIAAAQTPFLAARARQLISQTQDIPHQVAAAGLHNAVVIAVSGTGLIWQ